jgi:hypothetical protein
VTNQYLLNMIIALIILGVLILFFILKRLFKNDDIFYRHYNKKEKDGSLNARVPFAYVKKTKQVKWRFESFAKKPIEDIQCPQCGLQAQDLHWFEYSSSDEWWKNLAGSEGIYLRCPVCDIEIVNIMMANS